MPLPVQKDPRKRILAIGLGAIASALFAIAIPLGVTLYADSLGLTMDELFRSSFVSLIATLWIFLSIALTAVAIYETLQAQFRRAEVGATWITLGATAGLLCALVATLAGLTGAFIGVLAGSLFLISGVVDLL